MSAVHITAEGNLTADPELRFTPSGKSVVNFTIACSERVPDGHGGFKDSDATFLRCQYWGKPAERLVESVVRGDALVVTGRFQQRSYERRDGEKGTSLEVVCSAVGVMTTFTDAPTSRMRESGGPSDSASTADGWGSGQSDEVPF